MKKNILLLLSVSSLFAGDVVINQNSWQLLGTQVDTNLSNLNLTNNDTIWNYKNNSWNCFKKNTNLSEVCNQIATLNSGDAFWLLSENDYNLTLENNSSITTDVALSQGWNMVTPIVDTININDIYSFKNINSIWSYDNNWSLWTPFINDTNYSKPTNININQGYWVYANEPILGDKIFKDANITYNSYVDFGSSKGGINSGKFSTITKSSTDDIADLWSVRFKISDTNLTNFNIAFRLLKDNGAYANIIYDGLTITDGTINTQNLLLIEGKKSDANITQTIPYTKDSTNFTNIFSDLISLKNNIININLGSFMYTQTDTDISTFKSTGTYHINITSDKLNILDSNITSLGTLGLYKNEIINNIDVNFTYINTKTISGDLIIK